MNKKGAGFIQRIKGFYVKHKKARLQKEEEKMVEAELPSILSIFQDSARPEDHLPQTVRLREFLCAENPPIAQILSSGVVPYLICFLARKEAIQLQIEAAWCLTNLANGTEEQARMLMGAIPLLVPLVNHEDENLALQAVWALGNIAGNIEDLSLLVLHHGLLPRLIHFLSHTKDLEAQQVGMLTCALLQFPKENRQIWASMFDLVLPYFLESTDLDVLKSAVSVVEQLANKASCSQIRTMVEAQVGPRMLQLISEFSHDREMFQSLLHVLGNWTADESEFGLHHLLDLNLLTVLNRYLEQKMDSRIHAAICWILSNVVTDTHSDIQSFLNTNLLTQMESLLRQKNCPPCLKRECCWVITNALVCGDAKQARTVFETKLPQLMMTFLVPHEDVRLLKLLLTLFLDLLKGKPTLAVELLSLSGTRKRLRVLQTHPIPEVANGVERILLLS